MSIAAHVGRANTLDAPGPDGSPVKWTVGRWTRKTWDAFLAWARTQLPDPLAVAERLMAKLPERFHELIVRECIARSNAYLSINSPEVMQLLGSPEGEGYLLWLLLQKAHPDVTLEDAWAVRLAQEPEQMKEALDLAAGRVPKAAEGNPLAPAA